MSATAAIERVQYLAGTPAPVVVKVRIPVTSMFCVPRQVNQMSGINFRQDGFKRGRRQQIMFDVLARNCVGIAADCYAFDSSGRQSGNEMPSDETRSTGNKNPHYRISSFGIAVTNFVPRFFSAESCLITSGAMFQGKMST